MHRVKNLTFKFQAIEEQCYLVQEEVARRWKEPRPQHKSRVVRGVLKSVISTNHH
jgi:hypothetical protein